MDDIGIAHSNGCKSRTRPDSGKCIAAQQAILTALDMMNMRILL